MSFMNFIESDWFDAIFGFYGLPFLLVFGGGIFFGIKVGLLCCLIWGIMFIYSVVKLETTKDERRAKSK